MRQFKIINYKPYEYELLQEQLNNLGKDGYECKDLSLFSFFKKTNHPVYYKIDFFKQIGTSRTEQMVLRERFFQPYIDHDYVLIGKSKNMYVFMGNKDVQIKTHHNRQITNKINFNYLSVFLFVMLAFIFLTYKLITNANIDTFLTYGMIFVTLGSLIIGASAMYRTFINFIMMNKFHIAQSKKASLLKDVDLRTYRSVYKILISLSFVMIIGGMIEDVFNSKSFTPDVHPVLTLADLSVKNKSNKEYKVQSSFLVPHTYTTLEITEHQDVLYTKEYQFISSSFANYFYQNIKKNPSSQGLTLIKEKNNVLYGYTKDDLTTLIIKDDKKIHFISVTFSLDKDQIETIIKHEKRPQSLF